MPHCIIEHSSTIEGSRLMSPVYAGALASKLFSADGSDIKVRSKAFDYCQTAGETADFIHVALKILSGRTQEQKTRLSHLVLEQLTRLAFTQCSISVEVIDIDRQSYAKVVA